MAICTGTDYTQRILRTDCIGNSLNVINNNFLNLDLETCRLDNEIVALQNTVGGSSPLLCGLRLSLDPNTPTPTTNRIGSFASVLFLHPYKGNVFSLYDSAVSKWNSYHLTSVVNASLAGLPADTNFDIYLYKNGASFELEFVAWTNNGPGGTSPTRSYQDNVIVKAGDPGKRLIGCLRTTGTIGQSEQSFLGFNNGGFHAKQYLWNAQSIIPVTASGFDSEQYSVTTPGAVAPLGVGDTGFKRVNFASTNTGKNNRFSFIVGDITSVDAVGQVYGYSTAVSPAVYSAFGVNEEDNPYTTTIGNYAQLLGEHRGGSQVTARAHLKHNFVAGFHYLQLFQRVVVVGSVGSVITMNNDVSIAGSSGIDINRGKTGIVASLNN